MRKNDARETKTIAKENKTLREAAGIIFARTGTNPGTIVVRTGYGTEIEITTYFKFTEASDDARPSGVNPFAAAQIARAWPQRHNRFMREVLRTLIRDARLHRVLFGASNRQDGRGSRR